MSSFANMHVISANSSVYRSWSCDSDSKAIQLGSLSCIRSQTSTYQGLRSLKNLGNNHTRASLRTTSARKSSLNEDARPSSSVIVCESQMRIVFVGTEVAPWSKTGGLGEVLGSLPPAMAARGHRVMTITPRYDQYSDAWDTSVVVEVKVGDELHNVRYFHSIEDGVDRVFVDHPMFLEKVWGETGPLLYGSESGEDYTDNCKRFSLLCQAALEAPRVLNLKTSDNSSETYGEDVVFVCNDWHTSLLPCFLKSNYQSHGIYKNAKSVLCIHNISFQGRFPFSEFTDLGLPETLKSSFDFIDSYTDGERKSNWLKAGILEADKVLTVSPHHAKEVVTDEFKGMELEDIIRNTGITGILNGMNVKNWNPSTDKYIPVKFDSTTVMDAKPIIKEVLQAEVGLPVDRNVPLMAYIGRLEEQKGSDVLLESIPGLSDENFQLVALGTGNKRFEKQIEDLEDKYPNKARGMAKYNAKLAHMIIAGADFVIIPSRFEPCGLIQMEAMQYGTVPIVSSTGGLVDSVKEGYTGFHMGGFNVDGSIVDPKDVESLTKTVKRAIKVYGTPAFTQITKNCMDQDFSWKEPARNWEKVLETLDRHGKQATIHLQENAPAAREKMTVF